MASSIANRGAHEGLFLALLAAHVLASSIARAQASPADAHAAEQLFNQGRALMEQGKFAQACPLFAESQRLDPGGGTLLNLAVCHEKEGRIATALGEFETALLQAQRDKRKDREAIARERIAALAPKVPHLIITLGAGVAEIDGLSVTVDTNEVKRESFGTAMPVDPGLHRIDASAPGRKRATFVLPIPEGTTKPLEIPMLVEEGTSNVSPCPQGYAWTGRLCEPLAPPTPTPAPVPEPVQPRREEETRQSTWFYVTLAGASAAAGTSILTGVLALNAQDSYNSKCIPSRNYCPDPTGADDGARAKTLAWVSTITLGVALVGGIVAIALPREKVERAPKPSAATARPQVFVGPDGAGVAGAF
jgi:hypothetical protein